MGTWGAAPPGMRRYAIFTIGFPISVIVRGGGGAACNACSRRSDEAGGRREGEPHGSYFSIRLPSVVSHPRSLARSLTLRASCRRARKYIFSQVRLTCTRSSRSQRRRRSKSLGRRGRRDEDFPPIGNREKSSVQAPPNSFGSCDCRYVRTDHLTNDPRLPWNRGSTNQATRLADIYCSRRKLGKSCYLGRAEDPLLPRSTCRHSLRRRRSSSPLPISISPSSSSVTVTCKKRTETAGSSLPKKCFSSL